MKKADYITLIKNAILILIVLGIIFAQFIGTINAVKAISTTISTEEDGIDKLYISLKTVSDDGWGYRYGTSTRNIWRMGSYDENSNYIGTANNLYCAQADYGRTWEESGSDSIATYNLVYDFNKDIGTTASTIINGIVEGEHFNKILWLVDNMYVPGESNKEKFLAQADIVYDENEGGYIYISDNGHDYYDLVSSEPHGNYTLTDDDIVAIQQAALWYFTNNENSNYNKKGIASWLQYTFDGTNYQFLTSYSNRDEGAARNEFATILFNYLVDEAEAVSTQLGTEKYELKKSTARLWLSTSDGTASGTDNEEQPLLEIHKLKEFDLSLRKAIVSVKNSDGTIKTELNNVYGENAERTLEDDGSIKSIDTSTLTSGTTASYYHRKDPIIVEEGDIVEYSITIYNEGQADGYAKTIVDQLPLTGLNLLEIDDVTSTTGNIYDVDYQVTDNIVQFNLKSENPVALPGYDGTTLSYETIKLRCVVTAKPENENAQILTNIAYISTEYNSDTEEEIATNEIGADRDSAPGLYPVFQGHEDDNIQNGVTYWNPTSPDYGYIGNDKNINYSLNSELYFEGEEDDDDFEKIILMPKKDITVTKEWNDEDNQDGIRDDYTVTLTGKVGETEVYTNSETLGAENLSHTWPSLAKYYNGQEIVYSVAETGVPEGYEVSGEETFTITNTHNPVKINKKITKIWEDKENQDGKRPTSIDVQLYADGVSLGENYKVTLSAGEDKVWQENELEYEWIGLDKFANGKEIVYTVKEITANGVEVENNGKYDANYTTTYSEDTFTITNKYVPELTEVTVTKTWIDNNNQDGKRPESIKVQLYAGTKKHGDAVTVIANTAGEWKYTWTNLDKYANGEEIVYTVKEINANNEAVENNEKYDSNYTATYSDDTYTITNTYIPETTEVTVEKIWVDNNNQDGKRPESIAVQLYADGDSLGENYRVNITVGQDGTWKHQWTGLPKYKNAGISIVYTVKEINANNEEIENNEKYDENYTTTYNDTTFKITNTYVPELTEVTVTKVWMDNNNQDGKRPESITVQLYADGVVSGNKVVLTAGEDKIWQDSELVYTWENLPKYDDGTLITYIVKEITASGEEVVNSGKYDENYTTTYSEDTFTITNIYVPETTEITVTKIWEDSNNQDGKRPTSINVQLYAGTQKYGDVVTITANTAGEWKYTWTNLEKYANGEEIVYIVKEINANDEEVENNEKYDENYTTTYSSDTFTITNSYNTVVTQITVNKVWSDNNDQDGIRTDSVTVILKANGEEVDRHTITEEEEWTYTFTNLPGYENGTAIRYTVEEIEIEGYTPSQSEKIENGNRVITITNTHTAETVSKAVLKIWDDNNNQDGIRPNSIQVQLYANGEKYGEVVTLTAGEDKEWQDEELRYTWNNLPKYKDGNVIVYSVQEINIAEGYTASYGTSEENQNTETVAEIEENAVPNNEKVIVAEVEDLNTVITRKAARIGQFASSVKIAEIVENEIFTITNTHIPEITEVSVEKLWNDSNNQFGVRPTSVHIQLYANGQAQGEPIELKSSNNWKYTWSNLPKKENGEDIAYTVKELNATNQVVENGQKYNDDYVTTYEQNNNEITITNTQLSFDLKLIKYISAINNEDVQNRLQNVDLSKLNTYDENLSKWISTGKYTLEKAPVKVKQNDYVTYTFRVYNEGNYDGYAIQISENIPEELEFVNITDEVPEEMQEIVLILNSEWEYNEETRVLTTHKLSNTLLEGYGKENAEYADAENEIDYAEISVILKVKEGIEEEKIIRNEAAISEDKAVDENGEEVSVEDRDSIPGNTDEEWKKEDSDESYDEEGEWPVYVEDDEDYDNIITKSFDLSLRKRIAKIKDADTQKTRLYSRIATLDTDNSQTNTLYDYYSKYAQIPGVKQGDIVTYSLVVYNEGEIDGYASLIVDALPEGLEFVEYEPGDGSINDLYGWTLVEGTENVYQTDYLSYEKDVNKGTEESTILKAYDGEGETSYQEIYIECKVRENASKEDSLLNVAQIADDSDEDGKEIQDKDSVPGVLDDESKWKNEDDLDIEILQLQEFDLALRKFITQIENSEEDIEEVTTRIPQVSYNEETEQLVYTHTKDALVVHVGDVVIYTLRVYNEGDIDGYASEIKDDIPEYLEYLPEHETNIENQWVMYDEEANETEDVEEVVFIKTKHLAKGWGIEEEDSEGSNLIKAFDSEAEISEENPDYKEVQVAFKIKDPNSTEYEIVNFAQISDDTDEDGAPIKDKDSETDNGESEPKEDDEDIEKVKVEYFDLSLLKYVTKVLVNENGEERVIETGNIGDENDIIPHVQINRKNIDKTTVKFVYSIKVTNEGQIAGEATEITDYVPEGLTFVAEDNELWTDEGNNVISTKQLEGSTLEPGESVETEVTLRWINGSDNLGQKTNVAEISEDYNEELVADKDSTPDNKKDEEDDIDDATVLLSVNQGGGIQSIYINLTVTFLAIILVGAVLIKKFVL